jgi:hypothetical protein
MAVTPEEEKICQLLERESEQKQESVLANLESLKSWLLSKKEVAGWIVESITKATLEFLWQKLFGC